VLLFLFWALSIPAVLAALTSWYAGRRHLRAVSEAMLHPPAAWAPLATLIVPIKGLEDHLASNLRSLTAQDYPDYELLIAVRDPADPALELVRPLLNDRIRLVIAGPVRPDTGEKIHNLLAAVEAARPASRVLAFADSDGCVEPDWLRGLVAPLQDPAVGAATGYRWYFPERARLPPLLRTVWNSTIAGNFGVGSPRFVWGGATALRRETFRSARVVEYWQGAVSDDYRLTDALRAAGLQIRFAPQAMVATPGDCSLREFIAWAVRQMIITRVYAPRLWWSGFTAHVVYCAAMAAGVAVLASGRWWALAILLLTVIPGAWRGDLRRRAARLLFPGRAAWLDRHGWACSWLTLPVTWIWLYTFLASALRRTIEWRGHRYRLIAPSRTERLA